MIRLLVYFLQLVLVFSKKNRGLIVVDVQNDFLLANGPVSVFYGKEQESKQFVDKISKYIKESADKYDFIIYTFAFYPENHCSSIDNFLSIVGKDSHELQNFSTNEHGPSFLNYYDLTVAMEKQVKHKLCASKNSEQILWPKHCIFNSDGAKKHEDLLMVKPKKNPYRFVTASAGVTSDMFDHMEKIALSDTNNQQEFDGGVFLVFKGINPKMSYLSAFFGFIDDVDEPVYDTGLQTALIKQLQFTPDNNEENTDLDIIGVGYIQSVYTALDAASIGYKVEILPEYTASWDKELQSEWYKEVEVDLSTQQIDRKLRAQIGDENLLKKISISLFGIQYYLNNRAENITILTGNKRVEMFVHQKLVEDLMRYFNFFSKLWCLDEISGWKAQQAKQRQVWKQFQSIMRVLMEVSRMYYCMAMDNTKSKENNSHKRFYEMLSFRKRKSFAKFINNDEVSVCVKDINVIDCLPRQGNVNDVAEFAQAYQHCAREQTFAPLQSNIHIMHRKLSRMIYNWLWI